MEDNIAIEDCLLHVYSYLQLKDIYQCMQVNELFYKASQNPCVWLQLLEKDYKNWHDVCKKDTLYETYKFCQGISDLEQLGSHLINLLDKIRRSTDRELKTWEDIRSLKVDLLSQ